jgi:predicted nuclease of predicted toxin-antitoxin system
MKILLDMNLSPTWVGFLRQAGFEAVHWVSLGSPTASDVEIMEWARLNDQTISCSRTTWTSQRCLR